MKAEAPPELPKKEKKKSKLAALTDSFFIEEAALTEYISQKKITQIQLDIAQNKGNKRDNLYALASELNLASQKMTNHDLKMHLDSMAACVAAAGPSSKKEHQRIANTIQARYAEFYKGQGDFSKSLYHYQNAAQGAKAGQRMNFNFELASLFLLLNNPIQFGQVLNQIRQYGDLTRDMNLLEKMLLYSREDSLKAIQIGNTLVSPTAMQRLKKDVVSYREMSLRKKSKANGKYELQSIQTRYSKISRWYIATHQYDSALKYLKAHGKTLQFRFSDIAFDALEKAYEDPILKSLGIAIPSATTTTDSVAHGKIFYEIGKIYERKNLLDTAAIYYTRYLNNARWTLDSHYEVARFFAFSFPKAQLARTTFKQSIELSKGFIKNVESLPFTEKKLFIESQKKYLDYYVSFVRENEGQFPELVGELYNLLLATKAIQLNSSLRMTNFVMNSADTTVRHLYDRLKEKRNELVRVNPANEEQTSRVKNEITELERSLYARSEVFTAIDNNVTWQKVQKSLSLDEAAIEVVRYVNFTQKQPEYLALIIHGNVSRPTLSLIGKADQLENRAFRYYTNSIVANTLDTLSYKTFWAPLSVATKQSKKVFISLDGVYYKINLNTLNNPKTGAFVLDEKHIETTLSTRDLLVRRSAQKAVAPQNAVLFGSPNFDGLAEPPKEAAEVGIKVPGQTRSASFAYLHGAKKEIKTLDSFLHSSGVDVQAYTDNQATEGLLKSISRPDILHIATHGFFFDPSSGQANPFQQKFNNPDPMFNTGLLFAGAANPNPESQEDGVLTAFEATSIDLSTTKLVVLSACETGSGEVQNGEGVFGLQRAFKMAGAEHLMMSLWKVDDAVTQKLMTQFYSYWMAGLEIKSAFFMAQQAVKKENPHPYYWGAFILL